MNRTPVDSKMCTEAAYDAATQTLEVRYANGRVWQYAPVDEAEYLAAREPGASFGAFVNKVKFRVETTATAIDEQAEVA